MKKLIYWLPTFFVLLVILALTLQDAEGTMQMTESVQSMVVPLAVTTDHADWDITKLLRKLAHTVEYFFLGLTAMFAFYHTSPRSCGLKAFGFCAVVSFLDQCLKGCLPTREFDATDFPFDIVGYVLGVWVMAVVMVMWSRRKAKRVGSI